MTDVKCEGVPAKITLKKGKNKLVIEELVITDENLEEVRDMISNEKTVECKLKDLQANLEFADAQE